VPKNLSVEQKANWLEICQDLIEDLKLSQIFFDKVTAGDESWVFDYDPETKRQSAEWHTKSPHLPKKVCISRSRMKTMIIVSFDSSDIVRKEFVLPGQTFNHACYKDILERLRKWVQRVRTDIADDRVLHHHKAPVHTAVSIREFLEKKNISLLPHPPYSPDLAPCDFCLLFKLKSKLKSHHFRTMENIQKIVTDELHTLKENDFRYCYDQLKKRWNHCINSQGLHFEGDNL